MVIYVTPSMHVSVTMKTRKKRKLCVQDLQSLSPGPNEEKPSYDDSEIPNLRDTLSKLLENRLDME